VAVHTISTPMPGRPRQVNAYLVRLRGGWLLVDGGVGTEEAWETLDAGVRRIAGSWAAVTVQVVTHMHLDHVGLAARSRAASGAPLWMGRLDAERMRHAALDPADETAYRRALLRRAGAPAKAIAEVEALRAEAARLAPPVEADGELEGPGGPVPGGGHWRFVWTPGHTAGHVSLFDPADRVLIAGDAVLPRVTPTLGVNRQRDDPVGDYLDGLDRLLALAPSEVLPGHGEPIRAGAARIQELRHAAEAESAAVAALLGPAARSCWELVGARYPGREMALPVRVLALRETLAHLDRLTAAGRATRARDAGGTDRYSAS
jgi:glyoxylase-like metal-dependent hydrolase (beta-lactamase superfamily II)